MILIPIILTSLITNLKYLAPFSTIANISMGTGIALTYYYAFQDMPSPSERRPFGNISDLPLYFGTAVYAFEGIALVSRNYQCPSIKTIISTLKFGIAITGSSVKEFNEETKKIRQHRRCPKHGHDIRDDSFHFVWILRLFEMGRTSGWQFNIESTAGWSVRKMQYITFNFKI